MSVNANRIITDAYTDLGVLGQGETLSAYLAQDGLRRLNAMVKSWQAQSLTVLAIQREIFALIANQQTYTIGPGGDFNIPRPVSVDAAGLWLNGLSSALSVTSITRTAYTCTVTQTSHPFAVGDEAFLAGANESDYDGLQTVETVPTANTWTFSVDSEPTTPATGTITAAAVNGQPVEIPRALYTDDAYQAIQIKNLSNTLFTGVYFNPTPGPLAQIVLWPRPTTNQNQLVLYLKNVFNGFDDLTTSYGWPDTPGYQEALEYNLALRLARPSAIPLSEVPEVAAFAARSLMIIKRQNIKLRDLPMDPSLTHSPRGGYNINTGGTGIAPY